ncbi:hypothetical protein NK8_82820 (plasmid) [Caballeronia sp. NK8]|nr:hypothetical protein NK8_82820 [Caballeronia sp. NK8]
MVFAGISRMPMIEGSGRLLGMVTEGDPMRRVEIGTGEKQRSWWLELDASTTELASQRATRDHGGEHRARGVGRCSPKS